MNQISDFLMISKSNKSDLARVAHPRVEDPPGLLRPELGLVVEAASQHLLAEGHDVRGLGEVKPLVTPHPCHQRV